MIEVYSREGCVYLLLFSWYSLFKRPLRFGLVFALLVASASFFLPNYYQSEACILPVDAKGASVGLGNLAAAAAAFGVSVPGSDGSDANFVEILNSRTLREKLLETEFLFRERTWRFGAERARKETLENYLSVGNRDKSLRALKSILLVSRDMKSKVISVVAETKSPELSLLIVRRALEQLEVFVREKGRTRGSAKAAFAENRLGEARQELAKAEDEYRCFLDGNRGYIASADPAVRLKGSRLEAEFKLRQQLVATLALSREQALMEEKNDIPILNVLDSGNLPQEKSRPARLQFVVWAFFLGGFIAWGWMNRGWILAKFADGQGLTD